ncbi:EAL domain-containing protein, partial [Arthrospira platensis SPKY2]
MGETALRSFQIEHELRQGVLRNELRLFLQPKVSSQREVIGYEALVRWQHPTRGLTPPCVFIPIAEESDLICDIGAWVFTEVCSLITQQQNRGNRIQVAVNISPR